MMAGASERIQILEMIERGLISPAEGERLLRALSSEAGPDTEEIDPDELMITETVSPYPEQETSAEEEPLKGSVDPDFASRLSFWRRWWMIPLWVGVGITVLGAILVGWAFQSSGLSFWFACAWLPLLLGVALMTLAWGAQNARWLHLRIRQRKGERPRQINLSLPLPLRFTAWLLRTFHDFIPHLDKTAVDELIVALEKTSGSQSPLTLEVEDGPDGEQVQIYIG